MQCPECGSEKVIVDISSAVVTAYHLCENCEHFWEETAAGSNWNPEK